MHKPASCLNARVINITFINLVYSFLPTICLRVTFKRTRQKRLSPNDQESAALVDAVYGKENNLLRYIAFALTLRSSTTIAPSDLPSPTEEGSFPTSQEVAEIQQNGQDALNKQRPAPGTPEYIQRIAKSGNSNNPDTLKEATAVSQPKVSDTAGGESLGLDLPQQNKFDPENMAALVRQVWDNLNQGIEQGTESPARILPDVLKQDIERQMGNIPDDLKAAVLAYCGGYFGLTEQKQTTNRVLGGKAVADLLLSEMVHLMNEHPTRDQSQPASLSEELQAELQLRLDHYRLSQEAKESIIGLCKTYYALNHVRLLLYNKLERATVTRLLQVSLAQINAYNFDKVLAQSSIGRDVVTKPLIRTEFYRLRTTGTAPTI